MVFAKRLRERREAKKLTQQELGEKVGVKKATICGWEAGRSIPSLDVVNKLADALGTTGQYLVGYSDEKDEKDEKDEEVKIDNTIQEIFSTNLQKLMELRNYSQKDLVKKLGVAAATVSDWCNGKKFPRVERLQEIADLLGVQTLALIEENSYMRLINVQLGDLAKDRPDIKKLVGYALKMDPRMLQAVLMVCEGIVYGKDAILE